VGGDECMMDKHEKRTTLKRPIAAGQGCLNLETMDYEACGFGCKAIPDFKM